MTRPATSPGQPWSGSRGEIARSLAGIGRVAVEGEVYRPQTYTGGPDVLHAARPGGPDAGCVPARATPAGAGPSTASG